MASYKLQKKAVQDLAAIWDYTFTTWSEKQADRYYALLVSAFEDISKRPKIGTTYSELEGGIRRFRVGSHLVIYRAAEKGNVEILRILHERMDLKSRLPN